MFRAMQTGLRAMLVDLQVREHPGAGRRAPSRTGHLLPTIIAAGRGRQYAAPYLLHVAFILPARRSSPRL